LKSRDVVSQLEALEEELATLRAHAQEEEWSFIELEGQLRDLGGRLKLTRREVADLEALVTERQAEFAETTYEEALQSRDEAAAGLADAISQMLVELEAYDYAQKAVAAAQSAIDSSEEPQEPESLIEPWDKLVAVVRHRINEPFEDELVEAASRTLSSGAIDKLPPHLREAARERTRARVMPARQPPRSGDAE
jgi:chromosome segregation ATPase